MELSNRDKAEAIRNSIETETLAEIGLISPTSYKQHNPNVATGLQAILGLHDQMPMDKVYTNVVRKFQDGDYGFVHVDYFLFEPTVAFDIHRFENGISVEHWDNLQTNPKKLNKSGRTMTDGKTKAKDHHKTEVNKALVKDFVQNVLINGQIEEAKEIDLVDYLYQNTSKLQGKKNGTSKSFLDLSQEVNPLVQNSNHLLEDLRRLNQLKDSLISK